MPETTMLPTILHILKGLLNAPDLILLAIIAASASLGAARGLIRTLKNTVGRVLALGLASGAARLCAPVLARFVVTPIVGEVFEVRAVDILSRNPALSQTLQTKATDVAAEMAESLAFFLLFFIFLFAMNILMHMVGTGLKLITKIGPIGFLDRLGGFVLGGAVGLVLCVLGLAALRYFAPGVFGPLGLLSPEKLAETSLTAHLLGVLPRLGIPLYL